MDNRLRAATVMGSIAGRRATKKNRLEGGFVFASNSLILKEKIGAGERSRTLDLLIMNEPNKAFGNVDSR